MVNPAWLGIVAVVTPVAGSVGYVGKVSLPAAFLGEASEIPLVCVPTGESYYNGNEIPAEHMAAVIYPSIYGVDFASLTGQVVTVETTEPAVVTDVTISLAIIIISDN